MSIHSDPQHWWQCRTLLSIDGNAERSSALITLQKDPQFVDLSHQGANGSIPTNTKARTEEVNDNQCIEEEYIIPATRPSAQTHVISSIIEQILPSAASNTWSDDSHASAMAQCYLQFLCHTRLCQVLQKTFMWLIFQKKHLLPLTIDAAKVMTMMIIICIVTLEVALGLQLFSLG